MEPHDLLTMGSGELGTALDKMLEALPPLVYQRLLINGGTKRPVGSIRKLRLSYKRYRVKLKRGSWVLKGLKDELWGVSFV